MGGDLTGDLPKEVQHAQKDLKHHQEEFFLQAVWDAGRTDIMLLGFHCGFHHHP